MMASGMGGTAGNVPVDLRSLVDVVWMYDVGSVRLCRSEVAGNMAFEGNGHGNVIAFRVAREHKGPRDFWVFTNGHGDICISRTWRDNAIHVREVIE